MTTKTPRPMAVREWSLLTPDDADLDLDARSYRRLCRSIGLDPIPGGYGFLHCQDEDGKHWTRATRDVEWLRLLVAAGEPGEGVDDDGVTRAAVIWPKDFDINTILAENNDKFPLIMQGWPDEWL
jgi:hypothetical protein